MRRQRRARRLVALAAVASERVEAVFGEDEAEEIVVRAGEVDEEDKRVGTTLAAHFTYGTVAGELYAPLASETGLPPIVKGVGFALAVWVVSYLGLLPATGLLSPATEHPARRDILSTATCTARASGRSVVTGSGYS